MKLDLPVDHPLAIAILASNYPEEHIILSLEAYDAKAWMPVGTALKMELTEWTRYAGTFKHGEVYVPEHLECTFIDPRERIAELERLTKP